MNAVEMEYQKRYNSTLTSAYIALNPFYHCPFIKTWDTQYEHNTPLRYLQTHTMNIIHPSVSRLHTAHYRTEHDPDLTDSLICIR